MFKNILVPLDESALAERALPVAKDMAGRFGATLHLLEAVEPNAELFSGPGADTASQYDMGAIKNSAEAQVKKARKYLSTVASGCQAEGLDVRTEVREATAPKSIKSYAADNEIDLIVIGTHGRGGIQRMLVGSVTDRVIRSVGVPVLVIPRGETKSGRKPPVKLRQPLR